MRGKVEQADNRNTVMKLIFLKFAGDKFKVIRKQLREQYEYNLIFSNKPPFYLAKNVFFL